MKTSNNEDKPDAAAQRRPTPLEGTKGVAKEFWES